MYFHIHNPPMFIDYEWIQVLAYLDNALEAATSFDEEQQYSRSMMIEPKEERRGSRARLL